MLACILALLTFATGCAAGGASAYAAPASPRDASQALAQLLTPPLPGITEASGGLYLNGRLHYFAGINAYNATSDWHVNNGCGPMLDDLGVLFDSVPEHSLIRTWAFEALGHNKFNNTVDFTPIDRVVDAARSHHDFLILTLSEQAGVCDDGHWHDKSWYSGGYLKSYNDSGLGFTLKLNYLQWVKRVVSRYRNDRTVAIYEPVNEPEATGCDVGFSGHGCYGHTYCQPGAASALRGFFDRIGSVIKSIDPRALVSTGVVGSDQCGVAGSGFDKITASKFVDIATFHDYTSAAPALPDVLKSRAAETAALGKALLVEESGLYASASGTGCMTNAQRAHAFAAKSDAARAVGADGYLPWQWWPSQDPGCSLQIAPGDPTLSSF